MDITWGMLFLISGLASIILTQLFATGRSGARTRKTFLWIGLILAIPGLISVSSPGTIGFLDGQVSFGEGQQMSITTPGVKPAGTSLCAVEDTTVTLSAIDRYTSSAVGGQHIYKINGEPYSTVSDKGTFTASPGDRLQILFGNASNGVNYFSELKSVVVPCKGTFPVSAELVQNGTLTIEVFNEEGNLIDSSGENETLSAGDVVTLTSKLKGTYQKGFPYGGIIVVEFNNSDFDDIIVDFGGVKTNVPNFYTVSSTANTVRAYEVSPILSNQIIEGSITLDVDDSNNPGDANDPTLKFYPRITLLMKTLVGALMDLR